MAERAAGPRFLALLPASGHLVLCAHLARAPLGHRPATTEESPQGVQDARVPVPWEKAVADVVHGAGRGQVLGALRGSLLGHGVGLLSAAVFGDGLQFVRLRRAPFEGVVLAARGIAGEEADQVGAAPGVSWAGILPGILGARCGSHGGALR